MWYAKIKMVWATGMTARFLPRRRVSRFGQRLTQPAIAFAGGAAQMFVGTLMVAPGQRPTQGARYAALGKRPISTPVLAMMTCAIRWFTLGRVSDRCTAC
jgi:hypothetical protein